MSLLTWFDNRTLFGCQCMLAMMFAVVFLWMNRAYPQLRGVRAVALGYLIGVPCTLLMVLRGYVAPFLSVTLANLLAVVAFLSLYEGVARFAGVRSWWKPLSALGGAAVVVVYYYSEVRSDIVPRIVAMGAATAVIRGATAWTLLGLAGWRTAKAAGSQWGTRLLLGCFLALLSAIGLERTIGTLWVGAPQDFMQRNAFQTSTMTLNVLYIAVFGLCFLLMSSQELLAQSQEESQRDSLSGALNRRGIEARLALELKRCNRSGQRLSVALVDLDWFKAINDRLGHAAGDKALRAAAEAMETRLRDVDSLGRYGGDEFLVVLPHTTLEHAGAVGERLRSAVNEGAILSSGERLTLSIGMTEASPEDDAIALIARADEALYQAKSAGRDCWRAVAPAMTYPETAATGYAARVQAEG